MKIVDVNGIKIGNGNDLVLIAGPCVIESAEHCFFMAKEIKKIANRCNIPFIFKTSFDKANRTSIKSYRGVGLKKGLEILRWIKKELNINILCDVHETYQVEPLAEVVDVIQIPAFLSRQTDLLIQAGRTGKAVNIKKGQFLAPWDIEKAIEKVTSTGNDKVMITERGTTFGYNNLVVDMRSLIIMKQFGYPVVFDATHSVQRPGGLGSASGGDRIFVAPLARAAVAVGCDAIFLEVHDNPDKALSDGPNMIALENLENLLILLKKIFNVVKNHNNLNDYANKNI